MTISGLPADTPELVLSTLFQEYRALLEEGLRGSSLSRVRFVLSGLQQRLFSSVPAFARSLRKHLDTLRRHTDAVERSLANAAALMANSPGEASEAEAEDESADLKLLLDQEEAIAEAATLSLPPLVSNLREAMSRVETMVDIATRNERKPDARVAWLVDWIRTKMVSEGGSWNGRRLIIFTEWEDTRIWLEKRLHEAFDDTDRGDDRIATFTGITGQERRERVKLAFNADPKKEPLRILLCTDAAREGINLQTRCQDLIHFDLPWNPSRLEQRNGRIDRKLQPSDTVTCRYFIYAQRAEDQVLAALVKKTETIRSQLGSAGQVLSGRIHRKLAESGIARASAAEIAQEIEQEDGDEAARRVRLEMADEREKRLARLTRELALLDRELERAKERVGVDSADLRAVIETALSRDGVALTPAEGVQVGNAYTIDADLPVFAMASNRRPICEAVMARHQGPVLVDTNAIIESWRVSAWKALTGRRARLMEIAPAYVDLAVRRWQAATGLTAVHAETERTFEAEEEHKARSAAPSGEQA